MKHTIKGNLEGYLWWSDATKPEILVPDKASEIVLDDNTNPFVIEGELYDAGKGESVSIRFVDGRYIIKSFLVETGDLNGSKRATVKTYLAQRMQGIEKLKYLQYWEKVSDQLCEGMETLQPGDLVFTGFKKKEE